MKSKIKKPAKKSNNIGKLIKVSWEDHYSVAGWQKNVSRTDPVIVTSVGYVMAETPKMLVLAQSWTGEDFDYSSGNHKGIIKSCITARKTLK